MPLPSVKPIFYFILIMLLLYAYIIFFRFIGRNILYLLRVNKKRREFKQKRKKDPNFKAPKLFIKAEYKQNVLKHPFWIQTKMHFVYWSLFLIINIIAWQSLRNRWVIDSGYQHKQAREYYALGHLLLSYEMGMLKFFRDPGSLIMLPIDKLQKKMIQEAEVLLPKNDGEIDIFRFHTLLYPYASREYHPNDSKSLEIADLTFNILEGLSIKSIADPKVDKYDRYLFQTLTVYYYALGHLFRYNQICDFGPDTSRAFFKDPAEYARLQQIVQWLIDAHQTWQKYPEINTYMNEHPKMSVRHYTMISLFLKEMTWYEIMNLKFRCDSETLALAWNYFYYYKDHYEQFYLQRDKYFSQFQNLAIWSSDALDKFGHYLCGYPRLTKSPGFIWLEPMSIERTKSRGFDETFPFTERYLELNEIINHGKEIYEGRRKLQPCTGVRCHSEWELMEIIKIEYQKGRYQ